MLNSQPVNTTAPRKIVEAEGFYASDVISIQDINPPADDPHQVLRILMPVTPDYYGSSRPVWEFAGNLALSTDFRIGMNGLKLPDFDAQLRYSPTGVGSANVVGVIERKLSAETIWSSTWSGTSGGVAEAYYVINGPLTGLWIKQSSTYNNSINRMTPGIWTYGAQTQAELTVAIAQPGTVRL